MARWMVLSVRRSADEPETTVAALLALGGSAVEEAGDVLRTWIPEPADPEAFLARAKTVLGDAHEAVSWTWEEERDWLVEWRRGLGARRVGEHIVVTPTWVEPERREHDLVITLDPQMAFGTGEHATTRLMLALMESRVARGGRVLDVGAGSAILAIAADLLGAREIDAVESDSDAQENAAENIARNDARHVRLVHGLIDEAWLGATQPYDLIVANVLSGVLEPLLPAFREAVRPGGSIILGGILREEAAKMRAAARTAGLEPEEERAEDEWWSAVLRRPG